MTMRSLLLVIMMMGLVVGCDDLTATMPETCEELAPRIIKLSEENENPFSGRVLKFYNIEQVEGSEDDLLRCHADATRSRGGDVSVAFFMNEDGDRFIGMEIR